MDLRQLAALRCLYILSSARPAGSGPSASTLELMNTSNAIAAVVLAVASLTAGAATDADSLCPKLPPNSGLTWSYSQGPDFGVCYAEKKGVPSTGLIGVYLGFHPSFTPTAATFAGQGRIEGAVVRWHHKVPEGDEFKVGLEALHELGRETSHIWLLASDAPKLEALRVLAEGLSFRGGAVSSNQALEPTRVGMPPLTAQLQRCAAS